MRTYIRNGKMVMIAACVAGACLLAGAALIGNPSKNSHEWLPMNEAMESLLEETGRLGNGGSGAGSDNRDEDGKAIVKGSTEEAGTIGGNAGEARDASAGGGGGGANASNGADRVKVDAESGGTEADVNDGVNGARVDGGAGARVGTEANADGGMDGAGADVSGRIDINRASAAQLDGLKGIGPAKAQAIVDDREKNGLFRSVEDLLRVKGIGEKLLASMKESVVALP